MKLCFFCVHCRQEAGFAYSEQTWQSGSVRCLKGHWEVFGDSLDLVDLGRELARAETCPDYTLVRELTA